MTPDLSRRIGRAFTAGAATVAERDRLRSAAIKPDVKTADDLPVAARKLLLDLEARGRG